MRRTLLAALAVAGADFVDANTTPVMNLENAGEVRLPRPQRANPRVTSWSSSVVMEYTSR